jgi:hypothetical protein
MMVSFLSKNNTNEIRSLHSQQALPEGSTNPQVKINISQANNDQAQRRVIAKAVLVQN